MAVSGRQAFLRRKRELARRASKVFRARLVIADAANFGLLRGCNSSRIAARTTRPTYRLSAASLETSGCSCELQLSSSCREGVAAFKLRHAAAHGDRRLGKIGPIRDQRFTEVGASFETGSVAPLQQRFPLLAASVLGWRGQGENGHAGREHAECRDAHVATDST